MVQSYIIFSLLSLCIGLHPYTHSQTQSLTQEKETWDNVFPKHCESFAIIDTSGSTLYCASRNRLYKSVDFAKTWSLVSTIGEPVIITQIVTFSKDTSIILLNCSTPGKAMLYRSCNAGVNFEKVLDSSGNSTPIFYSGNDNSLICTGWVPSIYSSTDKGLTWRCIGKYEKKQFEKGFYACTILCYQKQNITRFLVGCNNPSRIMATDDFGKSWKDVLINRDIESSALPQIVASRTYNDLYACSTIDIQELKKVNLFRSRDGGDSWISLESPSNLWAIACDSSSESRLWVGQFEPRSGKNISPIYESKKFGDDLFPLGVVDANLIWRLEVSPNGRQLFAATDKGLLRRQIN